jgi:hypothetical protein
VAREVRLLETAIKKTNATTAVEGYEQDESRYFLLVVSSLVVGRSLLYSGRQAVVALSTDRRLSHLSRPVAAAPSRLRDASGARPTGA